MEKIEYEKPELLDINTLSYGAPCPTGIQPTTGNCQTVGSAAPSGCANGIHARTSCNPTGGTPTL